MGDYLMSHDMVGIVIKSKSDDSLRIYYGAKDTASVDEFFNIFDVNEFELDRNKKIAKTIADE